MNNNIDEFTPFFDYNYENLPPIWQKLCRTLHKLYPYLSKEIILQMVILKTVQMFSGKRITVEVSGLKRLVNYFALILLESGGGKDRLCDDLDEYIIKYYKNWLITEQNNGLPLELEDATQAGFYELATSYSEKETGSILCKMSEFGAYLEFGSKSERKFISDLCKFYDCKIPRKFTKSHGFTPEIKDVTINTLLMTDPTLLFGNNSFKSYWLSGLGRRFTISFQAPQKLINTTFPDAEETVLRDELKAYGEELFNIFLEIPLNANYKFLPEAKELLNQYEDENTELHNNTENILLQREIKDRTLKARKLSAIISSIYHPTETVVKTQEISEAIQTVKFLSTGLKKFINYNPECNDNDFKAFKYLENNIDKGFSKTALITELCKNCGFTRRGLNNYFCKTGGNDFVSSMSELAEYHGYKFVAENEKYSNGTYYYLQKNNNASNLPKTIITNEQPDESEQF